MVAGAAGLRAHQSDEINGMDSMNPAFSRDLQSDEIELEDDTSSLNSNSTAQDLFDGEEEITGGTIQDPQEGSLLDNIQDAKDNVVDTLTSNPSTWSEGQKIGVAIGVAVALLLILVIWCKCCRKKKK